MYFQYQSELIETSWYKEVHRTEPSPSVRLPCRRIFVQQHFSTSSRFYKDKFTIVIYKYNCDNNYGAAKVAWSVRNKTFLGSRQWLFWQYQRWGTVVVKEFHFRFWLGWFSIINIVIFSGQSTDIIDSLCSGPQSRTRLNQKKQWQWWHPWHCSSCTFGIVGSDNSARNSSGSSGSAVSFRRSDKNGRVW